MPGSQSFRWARQPRGHEGQHEKLHIHGTSITTSPHPCRAHLHLASVRQRDPSCHCFMLPGPPIYLLLQAQV